MTLAPRVLDAAPLRSISDWVAAGGGKALEAARISGAAAVIDTLADAGLRGRGGAGFPTGTKWASVAANLSDELGATVVVNGAEGEPGSFKDRAILLRNPYRVIEGALIAASALGSDRVVMALKANTPAVVERVRGAIAEIEQAQWAEGVGIEVITGPEAYLYGEETGLLEVLHGRQPFPRVAPPWRRGADDLGDDAASAADADLAGPTGESATPPALVNNVETLANVPGIVIEGPDWFRSVGTQESPGTLVVTISGRTVRHAVAEVAMGTPLSDVIRQVGGGPVAGDVTAVLPGVSNAILPGDRLDTPLTYEHMAAAGSGLGAGAFIVLDSGSDPVAVAHGVSRFLTVESCGQCTPCKQDGRAVTAILDRLRLSDPDGPDLVDLRDHLATIADGARCYLATQHQLVVDSLLHLFPDSVMDHVEEPGASTVELVAEILDIVDEKVVLDESHANKQPDWTYDDEDSGTAPADRLDQTSGEA